MSRTLYTLGNAASWSVVPCVCVYVCVSQYDRKNFGDKTNILYKIIQKSIICISFHKVRFFLSLFYLSISVDIEVVDDKADNVVDNIGLVLMAMTTMTMMVVAVKAVY